MRIAFDLDDTLTPTTTEFAVGSLGLAFPLRLLFSERLRNGASELLRELAREHELWIYTTSLRRERSVTLWLRAWGIRIDRVINADVHRRAVAGTQYQAFTKAPALFGIDLLIDDLPGVAVECRQQNVRCLIVEPASTAWVADVRAVIGG